MILSFRCSPTLKQRLDRILAKGLYPDFSAFCEVALENQLLLEENATEGHGPALREQVDGKKSRRERGAQDRGTKPSGPVTETKQNVPAMAVVTMQSEGTIGVPQELLLNQIARKAPFALPDPSPDLFGPNETIPVDRWLFGQYNRLLPAKISIRGLCSIASAEGKDALKLESASARIAETAAAFGDYLRLLDFKLGAHRDEAISTAFPETGADGQKGRVRYQNHFVGHTVKGEQGGLLVALKLAAIQVVKNRPSIMPTKAGWEFALLESPILDDSSSGTAERFSVAENRFLLEHINGCVSAERFAYSVILGMLARGVGSPEAMNNELFKLLSPGRDADEEKEFVNTQRSGVLGRMTDLGLVAHERNGRNVSRTITPDGRNFLEAIKKISLVAAS
jgi:hypothetical protein